MPRRSKRQHGIISQPQTAPPPVGAPAEVGTQSATPPRRPQQEAFGALFQKAVAMARKELEATGTVDPTAPFVYGENFKDVEESAMKAVSIGWRNESHKELMRARIHEKVQQEHASAVVLLMPAHAPTARGGQCVLSGVAPRQRALASLTYVLDRESNTFAFSELTWHEEPLSNFFLEGLFTEPE